MLEDGGKMQKRISLLLVIVMIVTSLLACGKEKLNTKNESYEGKTGGFYTKQAIENWNSYDEADCTNLFICNSKPVCSTSCHSL